mmetsp:Transcript_6331/g.11283  ORF Transcript_6331/g.11283 Transcript_6331/m.11283 type:complete len:99 (+) Transcript_6331:149-445(+)
MEMNTTTTTATHESNAVRQAVDRRSVKREIKMILARGINILGYILRARDLRLTHVTSVVECQLYNSTPTYEQYADLTTLESRVAGALTAQILAQKLTS